ERDVDQGRFYLPDAEEGYRETIVSSTVDARPQLCQRLPGSSFVPAVAALTTGGFFIFGTYHLWWLALLSAIVAAGVIMYWTWTGTARIPEKPTKDVGLGLTLPLYLSGPVSVGWWGMCITMLADFTAFASLIFGYFFSWTARNDFPPDHISGPGVLWPAVSAVLIIVTWVMMLLARRWNRQERAVATYAALGLAALLGLGSGAALLAGPYTTGMKPTEHVYPAIVWLLAIWCCLHLVVGMIMQAYCAARRAAG